MMKFMAGLALGVAVVMGIQQVEGLQVEVVFNQSQQTVTGCVASRDDDEPVPDPEAAKR
ncbi:MAG: hypothetical protein KBB39_09915 [Phycicoccus sp.]|nr:hypothetical protein [Phycicoccus sp.]